MTEADRFRKRLQSAGLSSSAIEAAWPTWWSENAEPSPSARLELRFSVARKLGLDARSVLDEEGFPRFIWRDEARFKHLAGESEDERAAISSFGHAYGGLLISATRPGSFSVQGMSAAKLRQAVLRSQQYVRFIDLLSLAWSAGIPVAHLRVFPATNKRMAAMSVRVGDRYAVLLAKDSMYPPHIAFYLGHELGHIALGHLKEENAAIVDMDTEELSASDEEELEADRFALELLTGRDAPEVMSASGTYNAPGLADSALRASSELHIEPGTLALCFGYSTRNWAVANSAMRFIYAQEKPVWVEVNQVVTHQCDLERIPSDTRSYLLAVLGSHTPA